MAALWGQRMFKFFGSAYKAPVTPYWIDEMDGNEAKSIDNPLMSAFYKVTIWCVRFKSVEV